MVRQRWVVGNLGRGGLIVRRGQALELFEPVQDNRYSHLVIHQLINGLVTAEHQEPLSVGRYVLNSVVGVVKKLTLEQPSGAPSLEIISQRDGHGHQCVLLSIE